MRLLRCARNDVTYAMTWHAYNNFALKNALDNSSCDFSMIDCLLLIQPIEKTMSTRKILTTIALPYANGNIHLGHMVEAIQADIWVRFQKMRGVDCLFICGNDAHGSAIMLSAKKQNITPEALIDQIHKEHSQDYQDFLIEFDNFYSTHSPENKKRAEEIYQKLHKRGDISTREITQLYDPEEKMFLADRFIRGTCPRCNKDDQYGDNCEACGATYTPSELKNPTSTISGATPIEKTSVHYFFNLENYRDLLKDWMGDHHLQPQINNKLQEWFREGLKQWDISRDAPYFGFEIPDAPGKYFYVWLDAPVGYMASLENFCEKNPQYDFNDYWCKDSKAELYHFIGKDIVYFHALFWPAMLHGADYRMPTAVFAHGFLTVDGQKMSKSRGTYVSARDYLNALSPEYLRYYFAAKLNSHVEDIDLSFDDFLTRVNSDLVGKFINLASRSAGFIYKKFNGELSAELHQPELFNEFVAAGKSIADCYESLNYNRAVREIMALADRANQYVDHYKPWTLAKEEGHENEVQLICTQAINLFKILTTYLKPILPALAIKIEAFLNTDDLNWNNLNEPLLAHKINKFKPLMQRVQEEDIEKLKQ